MSRCKVHGSVHREKKSRCISKTNGTKIVLESELFHLLAVCHDANETSDILNEAFICFIFNLTN